MNPKQIKALLILCSISVNVRHSFHEAVGGPWAVKYPESIRNLLRESLPYIRSYRLGLDGMMAARIESYDLIICGTQLPVVTGFEMIRSIRMTEGGVISLKRCRP